MLLFSFSISFLLFRNTINICVLILHPAAWFNLPSVFCFVDCHSKASYVDVHRTDNKMASTGNEECRDLYGTVFGSVPNLIKAKPLEKGRVGTTSGIFTKFREILKVHLLRSLDLKTQLTGTSEGHPPQRGWGRMT